MSEKVIENSKVSVIGGIVPESTSSYGALEEGFYTVDVAVRRLSSREDILPLIVSERLLDVCRDYSGGTMEATGQLRSYNRHRGIRNHLESSVFVRKIRSMEEFTDYTRTNRISLGGYICKPSVYCRTPLGREITDILLTVS